jgi:hypothetical protein
MRDEDCYSCEGGQRLLGHHRERRDVLNEAARLQHGALAVLRKPEGGFPFLKNRLGLVVRALPPDECQDRSGNLACSYQLQEGKR